nr:uncharacterized protein LOC127332238 [Lolium perenne]
MPGRPPAESEARGSAPISSTESDPRARAGCSVARSTGEGGVLGEEEHWRGHRPRRRVSGELGDGRSAMVNSRSRVLRCLFVILLSCTGKSWILSGVGSAISSAIVEEAMAPSSSRWRHPRCLARMQACRGWWPTSR